MDNIVVFTEWNRMASAGQTSCDIYHRFIIPLCWWWQGESALKNVMEMRSERMWKGQIEFDWSPTYGIGPTQLRSQNFKTALQALLPQLINPNLPDPVNFVPFGTMRYSPFDINLISITCILFVYLYFCLFLIKLRHYSLQWYIFV